MTQRDQLLVLNIVDYLIASHSNREIALRQSQRFRQMLGELNGQAADEAIDGAYMVSAEAMDALRDENEALRARVKALEKAQNQLADAEERADANAQLLQMTVTYMQQLLDETIGQRDEHKQYLDAIRRQEGIMREQITSYVDMFRMTINYLDGQVKDLQDANRALQERYQGPTEASLSLASSASQAYFNPLPKLKALFSEAVYSTYPPNGSNGNAFCVAEKFGIIYLILVKSPYTGLQGETFAMIASYFLQNVIATQKYINSSRLIEKFEEFVGTMGNFTQVIARNEVQIGVCLVDNLNCEVEFSTTGFPVYAMQGNVVNEYHGGYSSVQSPQQPGTGAYKVKKLSLRKGSYLIMSSESLDTRYLSDARPPRTLGEVVQGWQPNEDKHATMNDFLQHYTPENGNIKDFLLAAVKF